MDTKPDELLVVESVLLPVEEELAPTVPLTATTVPAIGARSTVSSSAVWACAT